ncbi:MAG TPA: FtsX-like permease family protein [Nocardioides sp.]|nr:FtsX-like permease family protein [Nocardioides sp.]
MSLLSGWRLALRLAWREARRAKGRSLLVLVMVTFPVIAVVAADVAQATSSVSSVEGLDRTIGSSQALVTAVSGSRVAQLPDPGLGGFVTTGGGHHAPTWRQVRAALGGPRPVTEVRQRELRVRTDLGLLDVGATATDLGNPLTTGLFRLTSGRFPAAPDEVAVNGDLAEHGFAVGDRMTLGHGRTVTVVGIAESASERTYPRLVGSLGLLPPDGPRQWLVGGGPVSWDDVLAVNQVGAIAVSRSVIEHPPSRDQLPPELAYAMSTDRTQIYTVLVLIGVMALLEVVLLAGPAFAVGARRQSRTLALLAANGGTPRQSRRMILGSAVVLGSVGAVVGIVLGLGVGRAILPLLQQHSDQWFGPFQVRWSHLAVVGVFGLLSALLAAVVPAWIASRQDVVAVLAGRRGDRKASLRSPFVGVALLGVGIVLAVMGARQGAGDLLIAAAAVVSVFGMIFLVPVVVVLVARLGRRLPLPLRYAVRDAARHRTRTVPAVAAVAATVAGIVTLSIANTSDQAQARAQYTQRLPIGDGAVSQARPQEWPAVRRTVEQALPDVTVTDVVGVPGRQQDLHFGLPGHGRLSFGYAPEFDSGLLVGADALPRTLVSGAALTAARDVLARGGAVVLTDRPVAARTVLVRSGKARPVEVPATFVAVGPGETAPLLGVVSPALAHRLGLHTRQVGLQLHGAPITSADEDRLSQELASVSPRVSLYVEHGYQVASAEKVVLWILFGLAGVLMLGGTLTATFLALSDARPDLATLSAVGASPRTRRGVAAAYAVSVGVVGALLGAAVGFIPGIAVSYPLTRDFTGAGPSHYLAIPWLEIAGLVVALPVLTALVVGLLARSRLPLSARLE